MSDKTSIVIGAFSALALILLLRTWFGYGAPATADMLQAIALRTQKSPAAQMELKQFLKTHQQPTKIELNREELKLSELEDRDAMKLEVANIETGIK